MSTDKPSIPIRPIDFDIARRVVDDFAAERNVPTQVYPRAAALPDRPARSPTRKFTVALPEYVIDAMQERALATRPKRTARFVVLEALRAIGFEIKDADFILDGRRTTDPQST